MSISNTSPRKLQAAYDHARNSLDLFSSHGIGATIVTAEAVRALYVTWVYEQRRDGNAIFDDAVTAYLADRSGRPFDHHLAAKFTDRKYALNQFHKPQPKQDPKPKEAGNGPRGAPRQ